MTADVGTADPGTARSTLAEERGLISGFFHDRLRARRPDPRSEPIEKRPDPRSDRIHEMTGSAKQAAGWLRRVRTRHGHPAVGLP